MKLLLLAPLLLALAAFAACPGHDSTQSTTGVAPTPTAGVTPTPTTGVTTTSTPAPSPSASPSPTTLPGELELRQGDEAEFPTDMAMIIATGCWGCSGEPDGLVRVYRDASGHVQTETLLGAERLNLPTQTLDTPEGPREYPAWITGLAIEPTASIMAVSYCIKGYCGPGGESAWDADSLAVILRSADGGVTWQEVTRGGPALAVVGVFPDGRILTVTYTEDLGPPHYSIIPDNTPVHPPSRGVRPFTTSGQILWVTADGRLLLSDGTEFYRQTNGSPDVYHQQLLGDFSNHLEKGSALVKWPLPSEREERYAITVLEVNEGKTSTTRTFQTTRPHYLGWWSTKDMRAVISIVPAQPFDDSGAPLPALLDLTTGEYHPIPGPFISAERPYRPTGRTIVDAVQIGPFARVVATGSCLNVRAEPSLSGQVLNCAADAVLLHIDAATPAAPGWVEVTAPNGTHGYASTRYLEIPLP